MPENDKIIALISEYLTGCITPERRAELEAWLQAGEENRRFFEHLTGGTSFTRLWKLYDSIDVDRARRRTLRKISGRKSSVFRRLAVAGLSAAAVLLLAVLAVLLEFRPGGSGAGTEGGIPFREQTVLVLAGGERIPLERQDGLTMQIESVRLTNTEEKLVYRAPVDRPASVRLQYNELRVPRGCEYRLELSDGTRVHLNSGSSLRYPVAFGGGIREVEFSGEAYFEVAADTVPFRVTTGGMSLQVYGTSFNLNTYSQDRILTALVEGRVGIRPAVSDKEYFLSPSEVAVLDGRSGRISVRKEDLEPYLAWTRGYLVFDNETLDEVLERVSLWYDVDIFYQNASLKNLHFTGSFRRYDRMDVLLKGLSAGTDVRFSLSGRTLTVYSR